MCGCFASMCVWTPHVCLLPSNDKSASPELHFYMVVRCHVGAKNQKPNLGLLQDQQILLPTELLLQPLISFIKGEWLFSSHHKAISSC